MPRGLGVGAARMPGCRPGPGEGEAGPAQPHGLRPPPTPLSLRPGRRALSRREPRPPCPPPRVPARAHVRPHRGREGEAASSTGSAERVRPAAREPGTGGLPGVGGTRQVSPRPALAPRGFPAPAGEPLGGEWVHGAGGAGGAGGRILSTDASLPAPTFQAAPRGPPPARPASPGLGPLPEAPLPCPGSDFVVCDHVKRLSYSSPGHAASPNAWRVPMS